MIENAIGNAANAKAYISCNWLHIIETFRDQGDQRRKMFIIVARMPLQYYKNRMDEVYTLANLCIKLSEVVITCAQSIGAAYHTSPWYIKFDKRIAALAVTFNCDNTILLSL